jgi:hypothetical protein
VDVGVVRSCLGVAESGAIWLSEAELIVDSLGVLSQHLCVLLDPAADILGYLAIGLVHEGRGGWRRGLIACLIETGENLSLRLYAHEHRGMGNAMARLRRTP